MEKIDDIGIGARGTLRQFKKKYTTRFLKLHGYKEHGYQFFGEIVLIKTVKTKYGELVIHNDSVITYVGSGVWSVSKNENIESYLV